jgi:hypothetical protein
MSTEITITFNHLPQLAAKVPQVVSAIVRKTAKDLQADAQDSMKGPKHGRFYRSSKTGKPHRASAPGEAPAVDIGNLKGSISVEMEKPTLAIVAVGANYGVTLEYGSRKIAPRPYMRPAAEKARPAFIEALRKLEAKLR